MVTFYFIFYLLFYPNLNYGLYIPGDYISDPSCGLLVTMT